MWYRPCCRLAPTSAIRALPMLSRPGQQVTAVQILKATAKPADIILSASTPHPAPTSLSPPDQSCFTRRQALFTQLCKNWFSYNVSSGSQLVSSVSQLPSVHTHTPPPVWPCVQSSAHAAWTRCQNTTASGWRQRRCPLLLPLPPPPCRRKQTAPRRSSGHTRLGVCKLSQVIYCPKSHMTVTL